MVLILKLTAKKYQLIFYEHKESNCSILIPMIHELEKLYTSILPLHVPLQTM